VAHAALDITKYQIVNTRLAAHPRRYWRRAGATQILDSFKYCFTISPMTPKSQAFEPVAAPPRRSDIVRRLQPVLNDVKWVCSTGGCRSEFTRRKLASSSWPTTETATTARPRR